MKIMVTCLGFGFNFPARMAQYTAEPVSTEKISYASGKGFIEEKVPHSHTE
jgi:hypothetical protein